MTTKTSTGSKVAIGALVVAVGITGGYKATTPDDDISTAESIVQIDIKNHDYAHARKAIMIIERHGHLKEAADLYIKIGDNDCAMADAKKILRNSMDVDDSWPVKVNPEADALNIMSQVHTKPCNNK
jgi:hypothetical protein